jgi:hypothetical protein
MACFTQQCAVGVPVNRVSRISTIPVGVQFPQTTESLNRQWLKGYQIAFDPDQYAGVSGVHHEIMFRWEQP